MTCFNDLHSRSHSRGRGRECPRVRSCPTALRGVEQKRTPLPTRASRVQDCTRVARDLENLSTNVMATHEVDVATRDVGIRDGQDEGLILITIDPAEPRQRACAL